MAASPLPVPPELLGHPFLGSAAVRAGLVTPDQLRGPSFRPVFRNVHVSSSVADSVELRAAAAALVLPPSAVAARCTAASLHGLDIARRDAPVQATVRPPRTVRSRPGLEIREAQLAPDELEVVRGIAVTSPLRTCVDLVTGTTLVEAVVALDAFLGTGLLTLDELSEYAGRFRGRRNIRRLPRAVALADGRAESPMETRLRLLLVLSGLPTPEAQHEVWHQGDFFGRLDLAYPELRLGIEFDGALHELAQRAAADIRRTNGLLELGWRLLRYDASDYYRRPAFVVRQVRLARSAALAAA